MGHPVSPDSLGDDDFKTHALLIGATGSGKTTLLQKFIASDIERGRSLVLLDLRGDLVETVLALCADTVDPAKVILFDLREKVQPLGFNPLFGAGEPYFRALNVFDVIAEQSESWGIQLAETLRNALLLLAEAGEPLTRIEALFYDRRFLESCLDRCESESVVAFWHRLSALSTDRLAAFAMPVLNKVSLLLATKNLRAMLGHPKPIDLGRAVNTPGCVILVALAVDELHSASRMMGTLILSALTREIFARAQIPEAERNPIKFYVDEFENFSSKDFEMILSEGRRFRLSLILAHQTLSQLSKSMRSLILGNVGMKVVFRVGSEDNVVLNRDLTGHQIFDFTMNAPGSAVIWRRASGTVPLEIGEPIFGGRKPVKCGRWPGAAEEAAKAAATEVKEDYLDKARAFAQRVYAIHRVMSEPGEQKVALPTKCAFEPHSEPTQASLSLEEWL
jgi:hypothetical protein